METTPSTSPLDHPSLAGLDPAGLVLLLDVDGVLAPIVDDPAAAAVPAETATLVRQAVERCALVGVVTGRGVERAREMVPAAGAWIAGLHGAHVVSPDGVEDMDEVVEAAREHVAAAATLAQTVGWAYEDKGATVAIHFRQRGPLGQSVDPAHVKAQLQTILNPLKVEIHDAKQVLEIKPKGMRTKGDAVRRLTAEAGDAARVVVFVGDDRTDLDAFRTIDVLRGEASQPAVAGEAPAISYVKVAVASHESPAELLAEADVVLENDAAVPGFIAALIGA